MGFKVRNWRQFQHYKDRNPPWIKLHFSMLSSEDWVMLDDASRVLAIACMLIASRNDGVVPEDPAYLRRVAYLNKPPNFKPLIDCGFLEDASGCKQVLALARPETETETEKTLLPSVAFESFWLAWPKSHRKGGKGECWKLWKSRSFDPQVGDIVRHVEVMKKSADWLKDGGQFISAPIVYLRNRRWEGADLSPGGEKRMVV